MQTNAITSRLMTVPGALVSLVFLPVLFHLPELLGWLQSSPRLVLSGLGTHIQGGLLPGNPGWLDPNSHWTTESLGRLAANQWLSGQIPWWNSNSGIGAPLAAEMQPAALFLPFILLMHFDNGLVLMRIAMQIIAGTGMWCLLRRMHLGPASCLVGGCLFAFCGTISWFSHGPDRVAAFLPGIVLGVEIARTQPWRGAWVFAVALAGSIYAGFPETAYIDGLLALTWFLLRLWQDQLPRGLATGVIGGGICGLMLAAPAIWPFAHYLSLATIGGHDSSIGFTKLPPPALAMLLMPYMNGPLGALGGTINGPTFWIWGIVGGYAGAALTSLFLLGTLGVRREAALHWLMLGWVVLSLGKAAGLPGFQELVNAIPLMSRVAFCRYMDAAFAFALIVPAAFAIDNWIAYHAEVPRLRQAVSAALGSIALIAMALLASRHLIQVMVHIEGDKPFLYGSLTWCLLVSILLPLLMGYRASRLSRACLFLLIALDTGAMSGITLLSSPHGKIDNALPEFLRSRTGIDRVMGIGGSLAPNEGGDAGFAAINETMLPAPANWDNLLHTRMKPEADAITFPYDYLSLDMFLANLDMYRGLGITLLATSQKEALSHGATTAKADAERHAWMLAPGQSLSGIVPAMPSVPKLIDRIAVDIGTYNGESDGTLHLRLCQPALCVQAAASLRGAADNAPLDFHLDRGIPIGDAPARWTLQYEDGHQSAAIWMFAGSTARADAQPDGPRFSTRLALAGFNPRLVFANAANEVYEVPDPSPYFQADGCTIVPSSRTALATNCLTPARMLRRELYFPGWRASINGIDQSVSETGVFQSIPLPQGPATIRFTYTPPYIGWAWALGLAGALGLLLAVVKDIDRARHRAAAIPAYPARTTSIPPI